MKGPVTKEKGSAFREAKRKRRGEYVRKKQNGLESRKQRTSCLARKLLPAGLMAQRLFTSEHESYMASLLRASINENHNG